MSTTTPKISVSNDQGGLATYEDTQENIPATANYKTATVQEGSWIIYNTEGGEATKNLYALMLTKEEQYKKLNKPITSVRLIDYEESGICLFGDNHYSGFYKVRIQLKLPNACVIYVSFEKNLTYVR